jgi:release factor glutamine methyltransferase
VQNLLKHGRDLLCAAGIDTAEVDARVLLSHVLEREAALVFGEAPNAEVAQKFLALIARRAAGEPVAYIIGRREFYGLEFALNSATLVPRPDSETLIEAVRAEIPEEFGGRIIDLGTGSGNLLLALLSIYKNATGIGVEKEPRAIAMARANANRLGFGARAKIIHGDFTWPLWEREKFDIAVSNPPYIPSGEIAGLARDVREYEPRLALDGGADGCDAYRAIARQKLLAPGGRMFLEIGRGQGEAVRDIFAHLRFVRAFNDLAGTLRVLEFSV